MATAVEATRSVFIAGREGKNGYPKQVIKAGQKFYDDDPRVKNNKSHFATIDEIIEKATAAPGEKRETKPKSERTRAPDRNAKNKAPKQAAAAKAKKAEAAKNEKARAAREKKAAAEK